MEVPALRRRLLRWYDRNRRDLPWRRTNDPYAIWVSEVMLQQTRVDVARPYYEAWLRRFPTVAALAAARAEDVLRLWSGLGYYSRARNLHAAAKAVVAQGGHLPASADGLRRLPGVGPYTATAVASIAHGEPVACVDGNVERVVSRLALLRGDPKSTGNARAVRDTAQAWLAPRRAGDWNQAVMDLGATVCTPRAPRCDDCPLAGLCPTKAAGLQDQIPGLRRSAAVAAERRRFAVVQRGDQVLLVRNPPTGLLAGLWSLPGGPTTKPLARWVEQQAGVAVRVHPRPAKARHQFSHRTWDMEVHQATILSPHGPLTGDAKWAPAQDLEAEALPTAMRTALAAAGLGSAKAKSRHGSAGRA